MNAWFEIIGMADHTVTSRAQVYLQSHANDIISHRCYLSTEIL